MTNGAAYQANANVAPPNLPDDVRVEDSELEEPDLEVVPLATVTITNDPSHNQPRGLENKGMDPTAFPPLLEANSGRKGRKASVNGVQDTAMAGSGRPPKDTGARRSKSKDLTRTTSRG